MKLLLYSALWIPDAMYEPGLRDFQKGKDEIAIFSPVSTSERVRRVNWRNKMATTSSTAHERGLRRIARMGKRISELRCQRRLWMLVHLRARQLVGQCG